MASNENDALCQQLYGIRIRKEWKWKIIDKNEIAFTAMDWDPDWGRVHPCSLRREQSEWLLYYTDDGRKRKSWGTLEEAIAWLDSDESWMEPAITREELAVLTKRLVEKWVMLCPADREGWTDNFLHTTEERYSEWHVICGQRNRPDLILHIYITKDGRYTKPTLYEKDLQDNPGLLLTMPDHRE